MSKGIPHNQVKTTNTITQAEHEDNADAKRVVIVSKDGEQIVDLILRNDGKWAIATDTQVSVNIPTIEVALDALTPSSRPDPDNVLIAGSVDGTKGSEKLAFVNNIFNAILATEDRDQAITYADPGTKNQRPVQIDYTSSHFPSLTARKTITYADAGTKNQRPVNIARSLV